MARKKRKLFFVCFGVCRDCGESRVRTGVFCLRGGCIQDGFS